MWGLDWLGWLAVCCTQHFDELLLLGSTTIEMLFVRCCIVAFNDEAQLAGLMAAVLQSLVPS